MLWPGEGVGTEVGDEGQRPAAALRQGGPGRAPAGAGRDGSHQGGAAAAQPPAGRGACFGAGQVHGKWHVRMELEL